MKRLKNHDKQLPKNGSFTHVCIAKDNNGVVCGQILKLQRTVEGGFVTTVAVIHMSDFHPNHPSAVARKKYNAARGEKMETALQGEGVQIASNMATLPQHWAGATKATRRACAQARMARYFVYGRCYVSKQAFEDHVFREMCQGFWADNKGDCPFLSKRSLSLWLRAEFEIFIKYAKFIVDEHFKAALGNPFAQFLHDAGTLDDQQKREAVAISFMSMGWDKIITICFGFVSVPDGRDETTAAVLDNLCVARLDKPIKSVMASMMADRAAMTVAGTMDVEEEPCAMHDIAKLTSSAIGALVRTKNKKPVNEFNEGSKLMARALNQAKYFSYSTRLEELHKLCSLVPGGCPRIKPQVPVNGTRVSAQHNLITSLFRLNKALKLYRSFTNIPASLTDEEWNQLVEFESVINIPGTSVVIVQHEHMLLGALSFAIRSRVLKQLRQPKLNVVDLDNVTADRILPRVKKDVDSFSDTGRECLRRAQVEGERRFCHNKTEEPTGVDEPVPTERESMALCLDFRTLGGTGVRSRVLHDGHLKLKMLYLEFATTARAFTEATAPAAAAAMEEDLEDGLEEENDESHIRSLWSVELDEGAKLLAHPEEKITPDYKKLDGEEFARSFANWVKFGSNIDWRKEFPDELANKPEGYHLDPIEDLMHLDVGRIYRRLEDDFPTYGHLPRMARSSRASIAALPAESYCERCISAGNLIMNKGNTLLSDEDVDMLVALRMNRAFMEHMRKKHPDLSGQLPVI